MSEREVTIRLTAKNLTASGFADARRELAGLTKDTHGAGQAAGGLGGFFRSAAGSMAGFVGGAAVLGAVRGGLGFVGEAAFGMNAELERSTLQFTTLMGDAGKAQAHVKGLFEFAKKTPFETGPIIEASRMLQTFGGEALNTEHNLTLIGDASAATGAPINELGFWVGRLYANLKAGQPFGEAAARLQELAVLSPSARAEMEAMQKAGKTTEEVFGVFQGRLGEFNGAMVAQASTWDGLKSSISDAVNIMMADALKPLFDLVKTGAQIVLTALGSEGMTGAFESAKGTISSALGGGADGAAGVVKGFINGLLTGVDFGMGALGFFGQAWGALKFVVYGVGKFIVDTVANILSGLGTLVDGAAKIPGVGAQFKTAAEGVRTARDFVDSLAIGMGDLTAEAGKSATGQDAFGRSIAGARSLVQSMQAEIAKTTIATDAGTGATLRAAAAKAEYHAQTKAEKEAEEKRQKLAEKGRELAAGILYDERLRRISGEDLRKEMAAGTVEIGNHLVGLSNTKTTYIGVLESSTALQMGLAGPFRAAVASTTTELTKLHNAGRSISDSFRAGLKDLPNVIQSALQGGGDVMRSVGASMFSHLFSDESGITKTITGGLTKLLGKGAGDALGAIIPGLGTALGGMIGGLADKAIGKLTKREGKEVNDLRDVFVAAAGGIGELDKKAHAAGLTLDRLLRAKNVKDYTAAVNELNAAFGKQEADLDLAREAMEEWGITTTEAGQKFAQADMDKTSARMKAMLDAAIDSGVSLDAIVAKSGDDFGKMAHQAIKTGTTIPASFRPVMAAMIEAGTLIDENGEKFTDLGQIPFAEDIGGELKTLNGTMRELADFFMGRLSDAFTSAGRVGVGFADGVRNAVARIPTKIQIEVEGHYTPPEIDGSGQGYAVGTKGRHGSWFVDFGPGGQDARLHNREAVITEDQAPAFVADWLSRAGGLASRAAAGAAGGLGGMLNLTVLVEQRPDGTASARVVDEAEAFRRQHNRMARAGALSMPLRAVGVTS